MPTLRDPESGCVYRYSTRKDSLVEVTNSLPLKNGRGFRVTIKVPKNLLGDFLQGPGNLRARKVLHGLDLASRRMFLGHKACVSIPVFTELLRFPYREYKLTDAGLAYPVVQLGHMKQNAKDLNLTDTWQVRLVINRKDLPLVKEWVSTWDALSKQVAIEVFFLSSAYLELITKPARGLKKQSQLLSHHLPTAYFASRELVLMAYKDTEIDQRIEIIMMQLKCTGERAKEWARKAQCVPGSYRDQIEMMLLVYRAFDGAWERYGLAGLREPQDISRQYLYGKKRSAMKAAKRHREIYPKLVEFWKKIYLGKCGAAARAFHLI